MNAGWAERTSRPHAFPKNFRLLRRAEFRRVYEEGQRRSASLCTVFLLSNGLPHSRLGITVPARVGKAVLRNRIKRRLREIFRVHRQAIAPGWDIVVNPRSQAAEAGFEKLTKEFLKLMPKPEVQVPSEGAAPR
jgi:ribonuclease P protein component